jgi:hypothetical protein
MRLTALLATLGGLAFMACADSDPAGPLAPGTPELFRGEASVAGSNDTQRPFRTDMVYGADYSTGVCAVNIPTGDPEHPTITVELPHLVPATGRASHMGRVAQSIWNDTCAFDADLGVLVMGGAFDIQAADGSGVSGSWTGTSSFDGTLRVDAVIDGGTGRFQRATGEIALEGTIGIEPVSATLFRSTGGAYAGTGWIAY